MAGSPSSTAYLLVAHRWIVSWRWHGSRVINSRHMSRRHAALNWPQSLELNESSQGLRALELQTCFLFSHFRHGQMMSVWAGANRRGWEAKGKLTRCSPRAKINHEEEKFAHRKISRGDAERDWLQLERWREHAHNSSSHTDNPFYEALIEFRSWTWWARWPLQISMMIAEFLWLQLVWLSIGNRNSANLPGGCRLPNFCFNSLWLRLLFLAAFSGHIEEAERYTMR